MSNKKIYGIIAVTAVLLTSLGVTFAYFIANFGAGSNTNINVESKTTDKLYFVEGKPISIVASQENFGEGMGNLSDYTVTSANLKANTNTNIANEFYNVFFVIDYNDFEYTTEDQKSELIMKVTNPNGVEVTSIPGLHYKTGEVSGFDITEGYGSFEIAKDYLIEATNETMQEWRVDVIFVNLETEQKANENKTFSGKFYLTKEEMEVYTLPMVNTISATVNDGISLDIVAHTTEGTGEINKYYFAIQESEEITGYNNKLTRLGISPLSDLTYIEKDTPNYKFTNLTPNTDYTVYSYISDKNGFNSPIYETEIKTVEYNLPEVKNLTLSEIGETSIKATVTGNNGTGNITTYYYSKDNGVTYESSTSNTYTFTNLTPGTNYQIKVYVKDNNNFESTIYNVLGTTAYTNPSANSAVFSNVLSNQFTITATAVGGTNAVKTYYYSKDNGATYQSSATNTYTYTGLTANTTYNVKVYVEDTLNYTSNIISISTKTATPTLADTILVNNGGASAITAKGNPDFATLAETNEGMYSMADDYGTSYYFRGAVDNNWVKFANIYWRIVRINGDNSVKLIYSGTTAPTETQKVVMTGTGTQITTQAFNTNYTSAEYVGYMYTLGEQRGLGTASNIKTYLENWYASNLASYDNKIADTIFCNDRSTYSGTIAGYANYTGNGVGTTGTWFGAARRLINASSWGSIGTGPSLVCLHKDDAFTKADTTKGNGKSLQKVGLLTADEGSAAGLIAGPGTNSNYLYTNNYYWLGSPYYFNSNSTYLSAYGFYVRSSGNLLNYYVYATYGVRAVVSLSSNISASSGNGTWNNPYVIN